MSNTRQTIKDAQGQIDHFFTIASRPLFMGYAMAKENSAPDVVLQQYDFWIEVVKSSNVYAKEIARVMIEEYQKENTDADR